MKLIRAAFITLAAIMIAACASTPESRIKRNQAQFDAFPAETQAKIKKGEIALGFTQEMVLMAKDKPDRKYTRTTAKGESEVWSYTRNYTTTDRQRIETRIHAPDAGGKWRNYNDWVWVDVQRLHEYEQFRIEFEDGKVSAFEALSR